MSGRGRCTRSRVLAGVVIGVTAMVGAPSVALGQPAEPTEQRTECAAPFAVSTTPAVPAFLRVLRFSDVWPLTRGDGQTVAVIDTGVAPHPLLPAVRGGGDFVSYGDGTEDCDAHGTVVAGLVAARPAADSGFHGGAPGASIISIRQSSAAFSATSSERVENEDGSTSSGYGDVDSMAAALRAAVDAGADIVNISEVACAPSRASLGDDELEEAVRYAAVDRDVVIVAAAGNLDGRRCRDQNEMVRGVDGRNGDEARTRATPAHFDDHVLTVGSVDADGRPSEFSLRGPWVDVAAPGTDIVSTSPTGAGLSDGTVDGEGRRTPFAGTSFAAPLVSATAALLRSRYPDMSAAEVISRITRTAHAPAGGWDSAVGFGSIDPVAAVTGTASPSPTDARPAPMAARPDVPTRDTGSAVFASVTAAAIAASLGVAVIVRRVLRGQEPS